MVELIIDELDIKPEAITYYSDSRVVLSYITNESRHFYMYVSNRVEWGYVPTQQNHADLATWSVNAQSLNESIWLSGPHFSTSVTTPSTCLQGGKPSNPWKPTLKCTPSFKC